MDALSNQGTSAIDRVKSGRETFERVMGASPDDFLNTVNTLAADYGQRILDWEFADTYNRVGLDLKTRELVIIASCATLGAIGHAAVAMHVPAALRAGASAEEIREVLVQVGFAAGLPTALGALQIADEAIKQAI